MPFWRYEYINYIESIQIIFQNHWTSTIKSITISIYSARWSPLVGRLFFLVGTGFILLSVWFLGCFWTYSDFSCFLHGLTFPVKWRASLLSVGTRSLKRHLYWVWARPPLSVVAAPRYLAIVVTTNMALAGPPARPSHPLLVDPPRKLASSVVATPRP